MQTRAELVSIIEELDADVASTARSLTGECFPLLVEVFGGGITWTDELCVADAIAIDWETVALPCASLLNEALQVGEPWNR